jgi:YidC/Oxa1 family membrane protein insertase
MDKRAFLAFALSMLLFAAFYWWYSPAIKKAEQQRKAKLTHEQRTADSLSAVRSFAAAESAQAQKEVPAEKAAPRLLPEISRDNTYRITVTSPLYQIALTTAGANIVSAKLFEYRTAGRPVELLPQFEDSTVAGFANVVLSGKGETVPLSKVQFIPFRDGYDEPIAPGADIKLGGRSPSVRLIFRADGENGSKIIRYYEFVDSSYAIKSGIRLSSSEFPFVRDIDWDMGSGLRSTEENKADDYMNFHASVKLGESVHKLKPRDFSHKNSEKFAEGKVEWVALQTKYFLASLIPSKPSSGEVEVRGKRDDYAITASMKLPAYEKRGEITQEVSIYLGPLDMRTLKALQVGLDTNINMGFKLIRPLSKVTLWSLIYLHKVVPNYGLVIIILSVFTKILFYRLTHKSFKSMRDMQRLQPRLQVLKEKYKDDKQKMSSETMKLYKEAGVNPLGGCLPMLLQAPVFIALFSVLKYTIELRGAGFVGWINDLSQQDVLYMLPISLPFIGRAVSVLPILMGGAMLFQSKIGGSLTGSGPSPSQPKAFTYMMPIVFTVLFYKMPSGLVLYWFVNNILSIGQQYYINKDVREEKKEEDIGVARKSKTSNSNRTKKSAGKKKGR